MHQSTSHEKELKIIIKKIVYLVSRTTLDSNDFFIMASFPTASADVISPRLAVVKRVAGNTADPHAGCNNILQHPAF